MVLFKMRTRASMSIIYLMMITSFVSIQNSTSGNSERRCAFHSGANWKLMNIGKANNSINIVREGYGIKNKQSSNRLPRPHATHLPSSKSSNNILDAIGNLFSIKSPEQPTTTVSSESKQNNSQGQVIRTAARPHQSSGGSIPSSRHYTTRKPSLPMISVSEKGVTGDYNHYRTVALKSTTDRAISILTQDVSSYIQTLDGGSFVKSNNGYTDGDLGENVLVKGVDFSFFKVGGRYRFTQTSSSSDRGSSSSSKTDYAIDDVIVEITEPMEPCANLCKLPFINDPTLSPARERVARCQRFIEVLGVKDGLRGWYAKVLTGGVIRVDDSVMLLGSEAY